MQMGETIKISITIVAKIAALTIGGSIALIPATRSKTRPGSWKDINNTAVTKRIDTTALCFQPVCIKESYFIDKICPLNYNLNHFLGFWATFILERNGYD